MKISTRARYGLRLMVDLAVKHGKGPILLKDVSRSQEISEKYLSQIIIPLKTAGLVKSFRGAHGGYTLQRDPTKINLLQVVSALEGDLSLVECVASPAACSRTDICVTQEVWHQVSRAMIDTLERITLADLATRLNALPKNAPTYSI
jgi:Rrf2 family protein